MDQTFKKNLTRIILEVLKFVFIGALFASALELLTFSLNIPISLKWLALFYFAREIAYRIRSHIFYEHKIYPFIAVIGMVLLYYISGVLDVIFINMLILNITISMDLVMFAINPLMIFGFLWNNLMPISSFTGVIYYLIDALFFVALLVLAYRYTK